MAVNYPIYFNLLPTSIIKGTGKQAVDDAGKNGVTRKLKSLIDKAQVVIKDLKDRNKESVVKKYEMDISKMNPKPATGFSFSCTIQEISTSVVGPNTTVGMKVSGIFSTWKEGDKGTGDLGKGFLNSSGKTVDQIPNDQKLAVVVADVANYVADDVFKKLEGAIANALK